MDVYMKIYNQSKILHAIRSVATEGSSWSGIPEWNAEMGFGPDLFLSALFLVSALTYQTFTFKNIFLALSKSSLLAIATSLTRLSRLFHIFSTSSYWFSMGRRLPSNWDPNQWTCYSCQGFEDVCLQVCGSPFYLNEKQKTFPKKVEKSKLWFQVWLQSRLPSSWREGDKCLWRSYIWHSTISHVIFKTWDGAWQWWMFEGFLLCRWLLEPRKASCLCKWVHTT